MTEQQARQRYVDTAIQWIGARVGSARHKQIIDLYNEIRPLPRNYRLKYTDSWCAGFVSAVGHQCGWNDIILPECSCGQMVALYRSSRVSHWMERDDYVPDIGDIIMYDWDDTTGPTVDNTGWPDHVGIVTAVFGGRITVIEGNISKTVGYRTITVNGRYIRGFCLPAFHVKAEAEKGDEKEVTQEQFNEMMEEYLRSQRILPPSEWSEEALIWAKATGISDATMPQGPLTREQGITMLHRLSVPGASIDI